MFGPRSYVVCFWSFFSRPSPKAGRELHIDRMDEGRMREGGRDGWMTLSELEPVTGP